MHARRSKCRILSIVPADMLPPLPVEPREGEEESKTETWQSLFGGPDKAHFHQKRLLSREEAEQALFGAPAQVTAPNPRMEARRARAQRAIRWGRAR